MSRQIKDVLHDLVGNFGKGPMIVKALDRNISNKDKEKTKRDLKELKHISENGLSLIEEAEKLFESEES